MFGTGIDRLAARLARNGRRADRRHRCRVVCERDNSRQLRLEPLEHRLLLAADFDFATASATRYSTGASAGFVAAGDLDGVNGTDLVVANDYSNSTSRASDLSVLMNNGQGVFSQRHIPLPDNSRPQAVDLKDVDGMNGLDIVVAAVGVRPPLSSGTTPPTGSLFVFLNNGNGTFGAPRSVAAGDGPIDVVAANLDGQGRLDYVTANFRSNDISVLLEQAGGVMKSSRLDAGTSPVAVAVGTINNDAHLDLAVANVGSNDISLFHGDGQGGFTAVARLTGLSKPSDLLLHDIDNDGDTDLVVANSGSGQVSVFLNDGLGSLNLHVEVPVTGAQSLTSGDLNHDGLDDLLVTSATTGAVSTLTNLGAGNFAVTAETVLDAELCSVDPNRGNLPRARCRPQNAIVAQLNADADLDVAIADIANGISVHLNGFAATINGQAATISGRKFEDLNGDGDDENGVDPGLGGVNIDLYLDTNFNGQLDPLTDQHVGRRSSSAGTGLYSFGQVGPGTHFLVERVPAGSTQTAAVAGGYTIVTQSGIAVTNRDFGNFTLVDIRGRKFSDLNSDGDDENGGDPGLGGVVIRLHRDRNGNGVFDGPNIDTPIATRSTAAGTGAYLFAGNGPGTYFVTEQVPVGSTQTAPQSGVYTIVARSGTDATNLDFGNHTDVSSISGRKFNDLNGDGDDENGGDPGLGGVIIELYRDSNGNGTLQLATDTLIGTLTTVAGTGAYLFAGNMPGTYFVREQVPVGSTQTAPASGIYTIIAQSGVNAPNRDFGNSTVAVPGPFAAVDDQFQVLGDSINNQLLVLANDTLRQNGPTVISGAGTPSQGGSVVISPSGTALIYTPQATFAGNESFAYTIRDQATGETRQAQVFIAVSSPGGGSLAVDDFFIVTENQPTVLNVLANDSPGLNPPLRIGNPPGRGTVTVSAGGNSVLYTPNLNNCGIDQFTYTISDQNGAPHSATVTVQVQPVLGTSQVVRYCLQTFDLNDNPISTIPVGGEFALKVFVQDTRVDDGDTSLVDNRGVFAAFLDVMYDSNFVSIAGPVEFAANYPNARFSDTATLGLINETGAVQFLEREPIIYDSLGFDQLLLFSVRFRAENVGAAAFQGNPSDIAPFYDTLLFTPHQFVNGSPVFVVDDAEQQFVNASITVLGANPEGESRDVNQDGWVTPIDVLQVVNELNAHGPYGVVGEGEGPLAARRFDTNRDGFVTPLDALFVINHINSRSGPFPAEGEGGDDDSPSRFELQPLIGRTSGERPAGRRAEAVPPQAGEHDVVFASWPRSSLVEVGSSPVSELSLLEFWHDYESNNELM